MQRPSKLPSMSLLVTVAVFVLAAGAFAQSGFSVTSPTIANDTFADAQVYDGFGCTGGNVSPALDWSGAPDGTQSFAVTMYDPDAPSGSGWWHWMIYGIPADATGLPENAGAPGGDAMPQGAVQGPNDFGTTGYGGPCPPQGDGPHHYQITVYALDTDTLDLPDNATSALVGFNLNAHALATAQMTVPYSR